MNDIQSDSDGHLWKRAQAGDEAAFGLIFDRHSTRVYNFCYRTTGSWSQAEDLVAIVFLQAWRHREKVQQDRDSVLPWLLAIANNSCRNEQRSRRRHSRLVARLQDARPAVEPDFSDDKNHDIDREAEKTALHRAIAQLRRAERDVVSLCYLGELTVEQAAEALGIPVGTAKSRLSRARTHLRQQLGDRAAFNAAASTHVTSEGRP